MVVSGTVEESGTVVVTALVDVVIPGVTHGSKSSLTWPDATPEPNELRRSATAERAARSPTWIHPARWSRFCPMVPALYSLTEPAKRPNRYGYLLRARHETRTVWTVDVAMALASRHGRNVVSPWVRSRWETSSVWMR